MLRKRLVTLLIETKEGRPEDWDWQTILFPAPETGQTVKVVNVEEA